jgi:hypothetical protein
VSLRGPPCAYGVSGIPFGEMHDSRGIKKTHVLASIRETRTAARTNAPNDQVQEPKASNLPSGSGRGRRNSNGKGVETAKGMKKTKSVPATTVNILFGRGENSQDCIKSCYSEIMPNDNVHIFGWRANWEDEPTGNVSNALYFSKHTSSGSSMR